MRMRVIVNKIESAHALQKCPLRGALPDSEIVKIAGAHAHSCAHAPITKPTRFGRGAAKDRTPASTEEEEDAEGKDGRRRERPHNGAEERRSEQGTPGDDGQRSPRTLANRHVP
ncbi:hypothetical protein NDU88_006315 [Pleurodeles waltl]|uniref:Uncharacterized protein n=1 Tax=Pleurodeles waltl TaxID=8319 RepID=A0AAV7MYV1_PLEWA|nr:hypothetical protein NDU88_006315 [Pleurodeles waltl]